MLEVRAGRQHHVAVGHAVGHRHVDADREEILAREAAPHPVLVGVHDQRIVVVDEHGLHRRRQARIVEVRAGIEDVERAGAGRHQVGPLQPLRRLGKYVAGAVDEAAAGHPELPGQRRQREDRADAAAAVLVALEPVADADRRRRQRGVPLGEARDVGGVEPARLGGARQRPRPRQRHVLVEAGHPALDERAVERAAPLELGGQRPAQHDVGAGPQRQVQVGLLGDLDAARVDHDQLAAGAPHALDQRRDVQVGPGDVVAPGDHEPRLRDLLGPDAGRGAEGPQPGLRPDTAAQRSAIEQRRAHAMEEAQVHRATGQQAVGSRVVERHHRLWAVLGDDRADPRVDRVERLVPRDAREAVLALGAHPLERRAQAALTVHELRERARHLGAQHAVGERVGARAADADDARVLDGDREAAGVGAIEGADAGVLDGRSRHGVGV